MKFCPRVKRTHLPPQVGPSPVRNSVRSQGPTGQKQKKEWARAISELNILKKMKEQAFWDIGNNTCSGMPSSFGGRISKIGGLFPVLNPWPLSAGGEFFKEKNVIVMFFSLFLPAPTWFTYSPKLFFKISFSDLSDASCIPEFFLLICIILLLLPPNVISPLRFLSLFLNTFSLNVLDIENRVFEMLYLPCGEQGHFRDLSKYLSDQTKFFSNGNQVSTNRTGTTSTVSGGGHSGCMTILPRVETNISHPSLSFWTWNGISFYSMYSFC